VQLLSVVPTIARFFGIVITMYFRDHSPPHFHASYGGRTALVAIDPPTLIEGEIAARALALVQEWARLHCDELLEDWGRARRREPLVAVPPLD
jgi:hypothetical protein